MSSPVGSRGPLYCIGRIRIETGSAKGVGKSPCTKATLQKQCPRELVLLCKTKAGGSCRGDIVVTAALMVGNNAVTKAGMKKAQKIGLGKMGGGGKRPMLKIVNWHACVDGLRRTHQQRQGYDGQM